MDKEIEPREGLDNFRRVLSSSLLGDDAGLDLASIEIADMHGYLDRVDLEAAPAPVGYWQDASGWDAVADDLQHRALQVLDSAGGRLSVLVFECTRYSWPVSGRDARERERVAWDTWDMPDRPSVGSLMREGMVSRQWVNYIRAMANGFKTLTDSICRFDGDLHVARPLLLQGFFLCMDLLYVCRALAYAQYLHAMEADDYPA